MRLSLLCDGIIRFQRLIVEGKINSSDIYDFYAVIGSLPRKEWWQFTWLFKELYYKLMEQSWRAVQGRVVGNVIIEAPLQPWTNPNNLWTLVDLDKWVEQGGSPKTWKIIFEVAKSLPVVKEIDGKFIIKERNMNKFADQLDNALPLLSVDHIENLFDFDNLGGTTSPRGIWYNNLHLLDDIRESKPRTPPEFAHAIDKMVQMMHHCSLMLKYTASDFKKSVDAVNAKFNASDPSEYWIYVDDYIRRTINKIRRKELGLDIILPKKVNKKKLFAQKQNEDEGEDTIEDMMFHVDASVRRRAQKGEQVQFESPENAYNYALLTVKGRWPEGEEIILQSGKPWVITNYAKNIIKGRWPEGEAAILKLDDKERDRWAKDYAVEVIKGPWPEAEKIIAKDPTSAFFYARDALKKRWRPAETAIIKEGDPRSVKSYATQVIKGRWPEAEPILLQHAREHRWALQDYLDGIKEPWPEGEQMLKRVLKREKMNEAIQTSRP
jgi:hypothetical protein